MRPAAWSPCLAIAALSLVALPHLGWAAAPASAPVRLRLLYLGLDAPAAQADVVRTIDGLVAVELARYPQIDLLTTRDLQKLLSLEQQRAGVECSADTSCLAEMANALGAELMLTGELGSLDKTLVVSFALVDTKAVKALARGAAQAQSLDALPPRLKEALGELVTPVLQQRGLMQRERTIWPWVATAAGGVGLLVGGVVAAAGLWPLVEHGMLGGQLRDLQAKGASTLDEARTLNVKQGEAAVRWQTYGQACTVAGGTVALLGIVGVGGGLLLAFVFNGEE